MQERASYWHSENREQVGCLPVIGLVGDSHSGKGSACEVIERVFDFTHRPISDEIRSYAKTQGLTLNNREDYWRVRQGIDAVYGEEYLLSATLESMRARYVDSEPKPNGFVVDGIRTEGIMSGFQKLSNSLLIGIYASADVRYLRRKQNDQKDQSTYEEFVAQDQVESEVIRGLLSQVDVVVKNEGTIEEFEEAILGVVYDRFGY